MIKLEEYENAMKKIAAHLQESLDKKGAVDMLTGQEFVGHVGQTGDQWWCDIYSWGVNHGKIYAYTREEVEQAAWDAYQPAAT